MGFLFETALTEGIKLIRDITTDKDKQIELEENYRNALLNAEAQNAIAQTEVNKVEAANSNIFVSGWRPAAGWACVGGLTYQIMFRPIFGWIMQNIFQWTLPPSLDIETLMTLLFGMLGLGAYRTKEKLNGVSK